MILAVVAVLVIAAVLVYRDNQQMKKDARRDMDCFVAGVTDCPRP